MLILLIVFFCLDSSIHYWIVWELIVHIKCLYSTGESYLLFVCFRWFFAMISVSGIFSVTFSIVFAYVADCTEENERSTAYGLVGHSLNIFYFTLLVVLRILWYEIFEILWIETVGQSAATA